MFKSLEYSTDMNNTIDMDLPKDQFEIEDIGVFEVLNSTFRLRMMRRMTEPKSVKELAVAMDVPVTRLYYHVKKMAEAGVITVVDERKVGAILEKVYQTTARSYLPGKELLAKGHEPFELAKVTAGVVLDPARIDAENALAAHFAGDSAYESLAGALGRAHAMMTPARAKEFTEKLQELLDEMSEDDDTEGVSEYALTVVFFPLVEGGR